MVDIPNDDPLLDERTAARYLGDLSIRTLQRWRALHQGPIITYVGLRCVRYRKSDLDDS